MEEPEVSCRCLGAPTQWPSVKLRIVVAVERRPGSSCRSADLAAVAAVAAAGAAAARGRGG